MIKENELLVTMSPHVTGTQTTKQIMRDVCIALIPTLIAGVVIFGFYSLFIVLLAMGSAVLAEFLYNKITKQPQTIWDYSAVVTGMLLGLNLPPAVPFYVPIIGSFFAIFVVKMLFGGIGKNFANPAITARIFLTLSWAGVMTRFVEPLKSRGGANMFLYFKGMTNFTFNKANLPIWGQGYIDTVTTATPLAPMKAGDLSNVNLLDMFLGIHGGTIGEVCALAILIGAIYLIVKKVIDWKIPLIYIATVGFLTSAIKKDINYFLPSILSGGLLLGAFFMATDYSTSPNTFLGVLIYSFTISILTVIFRIYGAMNEGVSFAILLGNILVPLLDKYIIPKPFGYVKEKGWFRGNDKRITVRGIKRREEK